jgi:hypothetical protein
MCKKNGRPYLGATRLTEHLPGLFFTGDGQAVDLRGSTPGRAWRSIVLQRVGAGA